MKFWVITAMAKDGEKFLPSVYYKGELQHFHYNKAHAEHIFYMLEPDDEVSYQLHEFEV